MPSELSTSADCDVCSYAKKHACWPPGHKGTHCNHCHRSWTGLLEQHCVGCHEHFANITLADLHRGPQGTCLAPTKIKRQNGRRALSGKAGPFGITWVEAPWSGARVISERAQDEEVA